MKKALLLAIVLCAANALAQSSPPPMRLRGTLEKIDPTTLVVKERNGQTMTLAIADNFSVSEVMPVDPSMIQSGAFVGTAAVTGADGKLSALEVLVFPEAMRGTGEGHYPWDLRPQSTMTNANVDQVVSAVDGRTLTLKYKDGEKKIVVPANAPIVAYVPGDKSDIKPGAKVFIVAVKQADGTLQGRAWRVGRDGVTPPM